MHCTLPLAAIPLTLGQRSRAAPTHFTVAVVAALLDLFDRRQRLEGWLWQRMPNGRLIGTSHQ